MFFGPNRPVSISGIINELTRSFVVLLIQCSLQLYFIQRINNIGATFNFYHTFATALPQLCHNYTALLLKWGASFGWSLSLYYPMWDSGQVIIVKTLPTLIDDSRFPMRTNLTQIVSNFYSHNLGEINDRSKEMYK